MIKCVGFFLFCCSLLCLLQTMSYPKSIYYRRHIHNSSSVSIWMPKLGKLEPQKQRSTRKQKTNAVSQGKKRFSTHTPVRWTLTQQLFSFLNLNKPFQVLKCFLIQRNAVCFANLLKISLPDTLIFH